MMTRVLALGAVLLATGAPAVAGTKIQMNIVPRPPDCYFGTCTNDGTGCIDNVDCTATLSAASKFKIDGKTFILKGGLKKVMDKTGVLITTSPTDPNDDYMLRLSICDCVADTGFNNCNNCITTYVRIDLKNGNGNFTGDLTGLFPGDPAGTGMRVEAASITTMATPASCGVGTTNSATDIFNRIGDVDCDSGLYLGVGGIQRLQ